MKALSIKQPWAWLICAGYKDIENRNWSTKYRGRIFVHAPKQLDILGYNGLIYYPEPLGEYRQRLISAWSQGNLTRGAIIGEVDITDCVTGTKSPWFVGRFGFVLANPVLYGEPIPCIGKLGFFTPDIKEVQ